MVLLQGVGVLSKNSPKSQIYYVKFGGLIGKQVN